MTVVFYISGHGFGHASRQVEVINALGRIAGRALRVIIRSAVSKSLLDRTVRVPFELRPGICDTGLVQPNSVSNDDQATLAAAREFYGAFDDRVRREAAALSHDRPSVIVCDISPLGPAVAAALGVPSIFVANFTWDWIYDGLDAFRAAAPEVIERIRQAQALASRTLRLPFAPDFAGTGLPPATDVAMIARRPSQPREATRRHFGLPLDRRIALLSFGGYGLNELDLTTVDCLATWDIAGTDRSISAAHYTDERIHGIDESQLASGEFRYEDLVAAVDAVLTKPGFGITGEGLTTGTPMLYTSRGDFREYDILVREWPKYLRCRFIDQRDLFAGRWRGALDELIQQPPPPLTMAVNGAEEVARIIYATS